ncbi:MAG: S49 family peptidase [Proteobacteria bacterium]|nr:S49 family peptidase [Pseudomonadota bacterium]
MNEKLIDGLFAMEPNALQALVARFGNINSAALPRSAAPSGPAFARNGAVAVIAVNGPIMPTDSPMLAYMGGTSLDRIRAGLRTALSDGGTERVVLVIDSPGGSVTGVSEAADEIFAARSKKPIMAYVGGMAASAAYWLASATQQIITTDTGMLGSIGVASVSYDDRVLMDRVGVRRHEIVSSQSPNKRPDLATDSGRAQIQENVDALAGVFIAKVARNRGTTPKAVADRFGRGGMMVGAGAVQAGLADALGSLECALRGVSRPGSAKTDVVVPALSAIRPSIAPEAVDGHYLATRKAWYALPPDARLRQFHNSFDEFRSFRARGGSA